MPSNQPQLRVTIGSAIVPGATTLHVESLSYFSADRFEISFAIGADANFTTEYFANLDAQTIFVDVAPAGGFVNLITGQIDNIRIDFLRNIAELSGRDLSARLIDTEISEAFNNQTASQVATTVAAQHGLAANVTATTTPVGQYYELDHTRSAFGLHSRTTNEWNLLVQLAQVEGFVLSVIGTTLNFGPAVVAPPVILTPQDTISLELDTATTIPAAATVKSWNTRNKMAITQTAGAGDGTTVIHPNLTAAQASAVAVAHLSMLTRHTTTLTAKMPGDVTLMPTALIMLSGTNSVLDQTYMVDGVSRSLDAHRGFTQTVRASAITS